MDDVIIDPDTPQENEFAMCVTCLRSPFLGMVCFPRRAEHYDRYLSFRGVEQGVVEEWKASFTWFLRKLTLKHRRRLLLKSPAHTARIRLLLELFPGARFVHIHRDPHAVFRSTRHLLPSLWPIHALQAPPENFEEQILRRYSRVYDAYFEDRKLLSEDQLHEIRYEDLLKDPVGHVRSIYDRLRMPGFDALRPRLEAYVDSLSGYRKNEHGELPAALRERVAAAWARSFEEWGYPV